MNLSAILSDFMSWPAVCWWPYVMGVIVNCGITGAIAYHYGSMVGRLTERMADLEVQVDRGLTIGAKHVSRQDLHHIQSELESVSELMGDIQVDMDSMREALTSEIVSKVLVSQEIVIARMTEALGPIDAWRAKNDLEFTRLLENWDELRRFTEDEVLGIKAQSANCFERIDACKEATVSANSGLHRLQQAHNRETAEMSERISAFQAKDKPRDQKPRAKKKPSKATAKKHG